MSDENETVTIDMAAGDKLRLGCQIADRMEKLGFIRYDYDKLGLGFELPAGWPADINTEVTIAQLTVFASKLKMRIIISNLDMVPRNESEKEKQNDKQRV